MTAPVPFCRCAHPDDEHWYLPPGPCIHASCGCGQFRLSPVPVTPPTPVFTPDGETAAREEAG